jgi:hypothetical protein
MKMELVERVEGSFFVVLKEHIGLDCNTWNLLHFELNGKNVLMVILSSSCLIFILSYLNAFESFAKNLVYPIPCWMSMNILLFKSPVIGFLFKLFFLVSKWHLGLESLLCKWTDCETCSFSFFFFMFYLHFI